MSWQIEMVQMLRIMINDDDTPYTYSDLRLQKIIVVSGNFVMADAPGLFTQNFICDSTVPSITPDPTDRDGGTRDDNFINLTLLKAGCFIDNANARTASKRGFAIREFGSSIDTSGLLSAAMAIWEKGYCVQYRDILFDYQMGNANACLAVLSPFRTLYNAYYGSGGGGGGYNNSDPFGTSNRR